MKKNKSSRRRPRRRILWLVYLLLYALRGTPRHCENWREQGYLVMPNWTPPPGTAAGARLMLDAASPSPGMPVGV